MFAVLISTKDIENNWKKKIVLSQLGYQNVSSYSGLHKDVRRKGKKQRAGRTRQITGEQKAVFLKERKQESTVSKFL